MFRKFVSILLLLGITLTVLTGCSMEDLGQGIKAEFEDNKEGIRQEAHELWDSFLDEINDWTNSFATRSITKAHILNGEREIGIDDYVGSYEADYDRFSGEEYIFGGTSLKRKKGSDLKVTYSLSVQSGNAVLYWSDGNEENIIADTTVGGVYQFTIHAGKNFIVLKGRQFTGSLSLKVE